MKPGTVPVTILIPTYRRPQRLERALRSALAQDWPELRITVFDNASGDDTAAMVARYSQQDPRVSYVCHPRNLGMVGNFRAALASVETPFFSFLCDDDQLLPGAISSAMAGLMRFPEAAFWAGHCLHLDEKSGREIGGSRWHWRRSGLYSSNAACRRICSGAHLDLQGLVLRAELVRESFIGFDDRILLNDVDLELQLASRHPIGLTARPVAVMYAHRDSISGGVQSISTFWPCLRLIGERLADHGGLGAAELRHCLRRWRIQSIMTLWYLGAKAAIQGQAGAFVATLGEASLNSPLAWFPRVALRLADGSRLRSRIASLIWALAKSVQDPLLVIARLASARVSAGGQGRRLGRGVRA